MSFNYLQSYVRCLMLHLYIYITASRTIINIVLSYVEFRHWTL